MIKMKAGRLMAYDSPEFKGMVTGKDRKFPVSTAFKLARILSKVGTELDTYHRQIRTIIENNEGVADPTTFKVTYPTQEARKKASDEIAQLNETEISIDADKVKFEDTWPDLSISEADLLDPITEF